MGAAFSEKISYKVSGIRLLTIHKAIKRCPFSVSLTINTKPEAALAICFAFFQIQNKTPAMQKGHPGDVPFGFSDKSNRG